MKAYKCIAVNTSLQMIRISFLSKGPSRQLEFEGGIKACLLTEEYIIIFCFNVLIIFYEIKSICCRVYIEVAMFDIKEIDIMPKSIKIDFQLFIEISRKIYFWPKPFV